MKFRKLASGRIRKYSNVRSTKGVGKQTIVATLPRNTKLVVPATGDPYVILFNTPDCPQYARP